MKIKFLFIAILFLQFSGFAQKSLPATTLKTLDGKQVSLNDYVKKSKYTVLSFWATWCVPCRKELDLIKNYRDEWSKKYNTQIIAITIDDARSLPKVKPLVSTKAWGFEVLSDVASDMKNGLGFQNVPYTFVLDAKGKVVYSHSGFVPGDEAELDKKIKELNK
jgi:cytochrome c biogenesis protein CcmG, thiol:disulfide interchange protein DsbE